ncbi:MAG: COR domain-containing protein [Bacteroidia bacterium]|nr:COR domain-containing protein [Bacteroidia bacterium]
MSLVSQLQAALGIPLRTISDPGAYLRDHYPPSYLEVVDETQEMVRSYHQGTAFTDAAGNLIGLNLYQSELTDDQADALLALDLPHLRSLNLARNALTRFTLSARMPALEIVALNHNEGLHTLRCEDGLSNLRRLDAAFCALRQFRVPASYTGLERLRLDGNKPLAEVRFDGSCPRLEILMLRGGALKAFRLPAGFDALVHLYLNQNQIETLELAGELKELRTLQLRENKLEKIEKSLLEAVPQAEAFYLGENPLSGMEVLLAEIEGDGARDHLPRIKRYFRQMAEGTPQLNNECKVLLIGNGKAGKTAIVDKLTGKPFNKVWDSTEGISLKQLEMPPYTLNLWDFGGQDIYHNTHRLFMQQNAVYLLAWCRETEDNDKTEHLLVYDDGRQEVKWYENQPLAYWMDYAFSIGKDSPMIVVQTLREKDTAIPKPEIVDRYGPRFSYLKFHEVDSSIENSFDSGYEPFLKYIGEAVDRVKRGEFIPEPVFNIRKWLREQTQAGTKTIPYAEYETKAIELKVESPRDLLEGWLFKSGVVYYRKDRFNDQIILNQGWAINAIYTLFDRRKAIPYTIEAQQGYFTGELVRKVWESQQEHYQQDDQALFINFMKSCDLCFEIEEKESSEGGHKNFDQRLFIAPQLLPKTKPPLLERTWAKMETRYLRYTHDFLHEGVIQSFIVQTAYLTQPEALWRYGIHLIESEAGIEQEATVEAMGRTGIMIRFTPASGPLVAKIRKLLAQLQDTPGEVSYSEDGMKFEPLADLNAEIPGLGGIKHLSKHQGMEPDLAERTAEGLAISQDFERSRSLELPNDAVEKIMDKLDQISTQVQSNQMNPISSSSPHAKRKILFLAANPLKTDPLQLDFETKEFKTELALGHAKAQFELLYELALDKSSFLRIKGKNPSIIHFSGHGNEKGICIQDGQNQVKIIPNEILDPFFKNLKGITELVFLNSCLSSNQAEIIAQYIPYVVGTKVKIDDNLAIAFSSGLYNGLGEGLGYKDAIERGRWSVGIESPAAMEYYEAWENGSPIIW